MCYGCDGDCAFYARQGALECVQEARESGQTGPLTDRDAAVTVARYGNDEAIGDEVFEVASNARGEWFVRHYPRFYAREVAK